MTCSIQLHAQEDSAYALCEVITRCHNIIIIIIIASSLWSTEPPKIFSPIHKNDVTVITQTVLTTKNYCNNVSTLQMRYRTVIEAEHSKEGDKTSICHVLLSYPKMELLKPVLSRQRFNPL